MSGNKRWLGYAVGIAALAAAFLYLRGGDHSQKSASEAAQTATPSSAADPDRPSLAGNAPRTSAGNKGAPSTRSTRSAATPADGSDIHVPKNTFGHDLPPPALPPKGYKPPKRAKKKDYTHAEKQVQRRAVIALIERRIGQLETKAKEADAAGNTNVATKIRIRIERMKQHRDRTTAEIKRTDEHGEPAKPVRPPKPAGHDGHDH